jgi:hypothetical protein
VGNLPTKAGGDDYKKFMAALALKESGGNPSAIQWDTKAHGLFQFIPRWHGEWIKEKTGKELSEYLPKDSTPEEMARSVKEQTETLFPAYYERELAPFVARMKKAGVSGNYSDTDLAAMAHFAGSAGAEKFLRTGFDNTLGTVGNSAGGIPEYVRQFNKNYEHSPEAMFEDRSKNAAHYGEYGLGRGVYETYKDKDIAKDSIKARNEAIRALYKSTPPPAVANEDLASSVTEEVEKKNVTPSFTEEVSLPEPSPEPPMPPSPKTNDSSPRWKIWSVLSGLRSRITKFLKD